MERIFSWLGNYRRLARNYEQYIRTAGDMAVIACSIFMLRYFRLNEWQCIKILVHSLFTTKHVVKHETKP